MQDRRTEHSYIEILRQSLEKKSEVLDLIMEENKKQAQVALAEKFEPEAFDEILDRKDELIKELEQLDNGFSTVYARVREELGTNKEAYKEEIKELQRLITEVTDKSVAIQAEERRNRDVFMGGLDRMNKEVYQAKRTKNYVANYYKNMSGLNVIEPQFMDKKK